MPLVYQAFREDWQEHGHTWVEAYAESRCSFVPNLLPELAVQLGADEVLGLLRRRLGPVVDHALRNPRPDVDPGLAAALAGPMASMPDGSWLKAANVVGVNVRTVGTFWNVVKYALTLAACQDAIHLLPFWEPGVVDSLYGISSWRISAEYFSPELANACPWLDDVERQLAVVVHLLHAMGKAVGMEVIPHTDRFSEIVLAYPQHFEWLQREGTHILDHSEHLHERVQRRTLEWLNVNGPALPSDEHPTSPTEFFSSAFPEAGRLRTLFGPPEDLALRTARRNSLVQSLCSLGYETVPATMAPPYRGLDIDPRTRTVDGAGNVWYEYRITHPTPMSRVFGPLTRFKLYGCKDDNRNWEIDFERPNREAWEYVCGHFAAVQQRFGFDFMRGDMSHVQMRPGGVPPQVDDYYDLLRAVKRRIQAHHGVRHFAYLAETFLASRGVMLYGDEVDHLEASQADVALGDLQSTAIGSAAFLQRLCQYRGFLETRQVAPSFTLMTGDKDDPRFDEFYLRGNALRMFLGLFLADMPSYVSLGFETRDPHDQPAPNEYYTKHYVFRAPEGPKATHGPYVWGKNGSLFHALARLRLYADSVLPPLRGRQTRWLLPPDATGEAKHMAWTQQGSQPQLLFVANTDTQAPVDAIFVPRIPGVPEGWRLELEFTTGADVTGPDTSLGLAAVGYPIARLQPGEGRVYRIVGGRHR